MSGRKIEPQSYDSDRMMEAAASIRTVAEKLHSDTATDQCESNMLLGSLHAVPVLYALAIEVALKAIQVLERQQKPDRSHNLLKLFEGLSEEMQEMLESSLPSRPELTGLYQNFRISEGGGMRRTLEFHQNSFVEWRYSYESPHGKYFQPAAIDEALKVIFNTYDLARHRLWKS